MKGHEGPLIESQLGELDTHLTAAQVAVDSMIAITNDYDFKPTLERSNQMLMRKTLGAEAAIATVEKAVEIVGGRAFYRNCDLERMFRDIQAAPFHPLPRAKQQLFSGRVARGVEPIG